MYSYYMLDVVAAVEVYITVQNNVKLLLKYGRLAVKRRYSVVYKKK